MKLKLFPTVLFGAIALIANIASAGSCEMKIVDGYVQITKGPGASKNSPTLKELFDTYNKDFDFFNALRDVEGHQSPVYVNVVGGNGNPVAYNFKTVPKKGVNDSACENRKITGYECRVRQLAGNPKLGGLPEGLDSKVVLEIPENEATLLSQVTNAIGCDEMIEPNVQNKLPGSAPSTRGNGNSQPVPQAIPQLAPVKK